MKADQLGHSFSDFLHAVWLDDFFYSEKVKKRYWLFLKRINYIDSGD